MRWLARAQDCSASRDGGVARHFSLTRGWATSYPETTGYIVPTFLAHADATGEVLWRERARRMLDWLVSIQLPGGGFQGGTIGSTPVVPVTFNTGQILMGLAAGARDLSPAYLAPMRAAADWLVRTQDADGCWRSAPTPFAARGEKTYETHVAWGLLEAARVFPDSAYGAAALRNVQWALRAQHPNGWMGDCCLTDATQPLTHTLGYALRGILEAYRFGGDRELLASARYTAEGLLSALDDDGFLPGRLDSEWHATVSWACLTGSAQVAHCWFMLFEDTGDRRYLDAGRRACSYVRRTVKLDGNDELMGGVQGSFPIDGQYGRYELLNWAAKFLVDACRLEQSLSGA